MWQGLSLRPRSAARVSSLRVRWVRSKPPQRSVLGSVLAPVHLNTNKQTWSADFYRTPAPSSSPISRRLTRQRESRSHLLLRRAPHHHHPRVCGWGIYPTTTTRRGPFLPGCARSVDHRAAGGIRSFFSLFFSNGRGNDGVVFDFFFASREKFVLRTIFTHELDEIYL